MEPKKRHIEKPSSLGMKFCSKDESVCELVGNNVLNNVTKVIHKFTATDSSLEQNFIPIKNSVSLFAVGRFGRSLPSSQ